MILDTPLPKLDFELISLAHGNGGSLSHQLLEAGIFSLFDQPSIHERYDGVILPGLENIVFSSDSFVVSPITFPGGDIGELAINTTVNNIAMSGGIPKYISLSFILEEGLSMEEFWRVLISIKYSADQAGVQVVTGDTKVVERGCANKIFINTSGIGDLHAKAQINSHRICKGDKIIVCNELANHGLAIMAQRQGITLVPEVQSDTRPLNLLTTALLSDFGSAIHLFRDPTRGGLGTALADLAATTHLGFNIYSNKIPISDAVWAGCERLDLDPIYLANQGVFLTVVEPNRAHEVINKLKTMSYGKYAAVIGEVTGEHAGEAIIHDSLGATRVLDMMQGEHLSRMV